MAEKTDRPVCGYKGDPVCFPPNCGGACNQSKPDTRDERPVTVSNETKPQYVYLTGDIVAIRDDGRFKGRVVETNWECTIHPNCYIVLVSWDAGNTGREHTTYLKLVYRSSDDKACQVFTTRTLEYDWDESGKEERYRALDNSPYLLVGDYAYVLGYDGVIWMAPYMVRKSDSQVKTVRWDLAVDLDEATLSQYPDFPYERLATVLADIQNISDIMRQVGVRVETELL